MNLPADLRLWTFDTVVELVTTTEFEPGLFDYKEVLVTTMPRGRDDHNRSIGRTVCSMANTGGGYILFGVCDRQVHITCPEDRIVGIPLGGDLAKQFADKTRGKIQPEVHFDTSPRPILLPHDSRSGVFVVHIPRSPLRPHIFEGIFYRRGDGGSAVPMGVYEVRDQMLLTEERLKRLTLLRLEVAQTRWLASKLRALGPKEMTRSLIRFDTSAFKVLLADICTILPPDNNLLGDLMEVASQAGLINQFLDRVILERSRPPMGGSDVGESAGPFAYTRTAAFENVFDLYWQCHDCERRLEEHFGPMAAIPHFSIPDSSD